MPSIPSTGRPTVCGARTRTRAIRVTAIPSLAAKWLLPRLARFRELEPEIDILVSAMDTLIDLEQEEFDMGLRYGGGAYPGLRTDRLMGDEIFPVCNPRLLEGDQPLREPADLKHFTLLHDDMARTDISSNDWRGWLKVAGVTDVDPERGPGYSHSSLVLQAAIDGQGVALGRRSLCSDDINAGHLVCPFGPVIKSPYAYYIVSPLALCRAAECAPLPGLAAGRGREDWRPRACLCHPPQPSPAP